jgi:spermidine/putrescine transport system permease protein
VSIADANIVSTPVAQTAPRRTNRRAVVLAIHSAAVFALLYGPIAVLVALSFNQSRLTARWTGFTLDWYRELAHDPEIIQAAWYSLIVAVGATLVSTTVGTMAALALAGRSDAPVAGSRRRWADRADTTGRAATAALLYLPIVIPEIVLACALLTFFSLTHWQLSLWTVGAAHVSFSVSYVAVVVRARLAGFDRSLEEAAMDLGAGPAGTFFRVKLPLIMPGIVAGALLVFTVSIDDYVVTSFVAGTDSTTLPLKIASMVKTGLTPELNAVSTLLLALTILLVLVSQRLQGPSGRGGKS